jgi:integrase
MSIDETAAHQPSGAAVFTAEGTLFKVCRCRDPETDKLLRNDCPDLRRSNGSWNPDHGRWTYQLELPRTAGGQRRQLRPSGFASRIGAEDELDHVRRLLDLAGRDQKRLIEMGDLVQTGCRTATGLPDVDTIRQRLRSDSRLTGIPTLAEYLPAWLQDIEVDDNTRSSYACHIRLHLIPYLGDIVLDKLRPHHVQTLIRLIKERNDEITEARQSPDPAVRKSVAGARPTGPATRHRIRGTLRNAFNDALRLGIVAGIANPAALIKTLNPRPKPIVWEPERVERWRATGQVPGKIMVWTDQLVAEFLDYTAVEAPDLHPMLHFMAYRGPRRGEACGLLDAEVRLDKAEVSIVNQIAVYGRTLHHKKPKSESGNREVILDPDTVAVFRRYKARRAQWQLAAGPAWPDTGLFFVRPNGRAWHPPSVSQRFRRLIQRGGFPPVRLHDLRHSAATIALQAGVDIKVVSEQLGHSTTTLTRDTYQSVAKSLHHEAAGAVAARIQAKRRIGGSA